MDKFIDSSDLIKVIYKDLHQKYGYSDKECQAYMKGYQDCVTFMHKNNFEMKIDDNNKEYYQIEIPDIEN